MQAWWQRVKELIGRRRLDRELDEEAAIHLQMLEEQFRERGMNEADARAAARREFGSVAHAAEAYRAERGIPWLEVLAKDVRYALRGLRRSPGFTAAAVLSLALGIGANTAIFSLVRALMLRMLPVARPQELVSLYSTGGWLRGAVSYPLYLELRKRGDLFGGVIASNGAGLVRFAPQGGHTEFVRREYVSGNYFGVLDVHPEIGRLFTDDDDRTPRAHPLAVLSHDFWRQRFGADPAILGHTLTIDEQLLTVIGVAAPGFHGVQVETQTDVWVPAMMYPGRIMDPGMHWLKVMARRRPSISSARIQAAVDVLMRQYLEARYGHNSDAGFRKLAMAQRIEVRDGAAGLSTLREFFGKPLMILMAAVGLVLLAACANVANLLLARTAAREKEIALRSSLGASRGRLVRQALTESLVLAGLGCGLGVAFALWAERFVLHFLPAGPAVDLDVSPDGAVLVFTLAISLLAVILFGLAPALRTTAIAPSASLAAGPGRGTVRRPLLRCSLVAVQVAFSVVLVVVAALCGQSLAALRAIDTGIRNQNVVAFSMDYPRSWKLDRMESACKRFVAQMESMPGVVSVSYGFPGPFQMGFSSASIRVAGSERTAHESADVAVHSVAPQYLETLGSSPILGRSIDRNDTATSRKVAVVNEAFLREFLPLEPHPLERALSFDDSKPEGGEPTFIVGVVHDIPHKGLRERREPTVYIPAAQNAFIRMSPTVLVASQLPQAATLAAIRAELAKLDPQIALAQEPRTIRQAVDDSVFQDRLLAALSAFFGVLALGLAAIGLYGVVAYGTAQRAGEFGIRIALGAQRSDVLRIVLREALLLVAAGLAIGLPASLVAARAVSSVLFGVRAGDPAAFITTSVVLLAVSLAAAFLPAHRSASMDPMRALRHE